MQQIFERTYFLTPAECNPHGRMPITLLINRLIEVATLHANEIGIGYASLVDYNETWVLSRVATEIEALSRSERPLHRAHLDFINQPAVL